MDFIQALVLFALGVSAAFLAYFAWHHVNIDMQPIAQIPSLVRPNAA